jgi:hypothetical protein
VYHKFDPELTVVITVGSTQPPIQWVLGAIHLEVKQPWPEAGHLSPSSAEVKNVWSYTSTPHMSLWCGALLCKEYAFMLWYLVKHKDKFTFTLLSTSSTDNTLCLHFLYGCHICLCFIGSVCGKSY